MSPKRIKFHADRLSAVKSSSSSSQVVSASRDNTMAVWNWEWNETHSMVLVGHSGGIRDVAMSSDGSKLLSASDDGTVKVWDLTGGGCIKTVFRSEKEARRVSPHGDVLAVFTEDNTLHLTEVKLGGMGPSMRSARSSMLNSNERQNTWTNRGNVRVISFSTNGKYLASGYRDGYVEVQRTDNWTDSGQSMTGHMNGVSCLNFSHDAQRLASSSDDGSICVWNKENGELIGAPMGSSSILSFAFSPDRQRIVLSSYDGSLSVWNV